MKKKLIRISILLVLAVVLIVGGIFAFKKISAYMPYYNDKNGKNQPDIEYTLTIEKSDYENEVAKKLEENGIIVSAVRFLGYLHENYPDFVCYNGQYNVSADMSYKELCEALKTPDTKIDYVKFTVPEGKTVAEIAQIVNDSGLCSAEDFLEAANSYDYNYDFMEELKARDQSVIVYKLEGYLFPATYEFRKDTVTAKEIVTAMLDAFEAYVKDDYIRSAKEMGLSLNEFITFASIIQAESLTEESMTMVSSIFWNRRNSSEYPRMESCPTEDYVKELKKLDEYKDAMNYAYNTYDREGLPVGPINSPGVKVMEAVLNPDDSDYFYFCTDTSGNFYYNKTYAAHIQTCYDIGIYK